MEIFIIIVLSILILSLFLWLWQVNKKSEEETEEFFRNMKEKYLAEAKEEEDAFLLEIENMTRTELLKVCKEYKILGVSKKRKEEIKTILRDFHSK